MSKRNKMPGLRLKGGIWQIEKRCKYAKSGWLRESTGTSGRIEAEQILIRRMAETEEEAQRQADAIFTFEEAGMRYLEEISAKPSAGTIAMHMDQLFPFIGQNPLEQIHDGTLKAFVNLFKRVLTGLNLTPGWRIILSATGVVRKPQNWRTTHVKTQQNAGAPP